MIPVFEPEIGDEEVHAVVSAIRRGEISGSFGESIRTFEREFADYVGVRHGVAVSSGTAALHLAIAALDLEPGSEVLVSASTNVATALAAYHNRCLPVPVDSERETWNLDLEALEAAITPRTKAIIPVHLYGHPIDMDRLMGIADAHGIVVVEDCAEAHGATCRDRMTGAFGLMGCFSFYANKVITTGEGGMIVTNDDDLAEGLRSLRNLSFGEPRFVHERAGFNFRMTGMQAAMGSVQLARIESTIEKKRRVAAHYNERLDGVRGLSLPVELPWARNVYWMYAIVVEDGFGASRDDLAAALLARGIDSRTFFCPMNLQPFLAGSRASRITCPVAEDLWMRGLYLPSSTSLDVTTVEFVADAIKSAVGTPSRESA